MHWFVIVLRSVAALLILFLLTRLLGKKQISQLSAFDYVIGISMGSIAAEMTINKEVPFFDGMIAMTSYSLVAYIISYLTIKSISLRRFFSGSPLILIKDGKILRKNLLKAHIDINDLLQECRSNGYFNIDEIAFAVIEACGKVSLLPKTENRPVKMKDLNLKDSKAGLCANVIIDGEIMESNLEGIKKTRHWLLKEIKKQGYDDPAQLFLASVDPDYKVTLYEKIDKLEGRDVLE